MITLTLDEIVNAIGARLADPPAISVGGVSTDSRSVAAGEVFFALTGERFDGHDFVAPALERGAAAAVVDQARAEALRDGLPAAATARLIGVEDVLAALGRLAAYHRQQLSATVIAVGGSNGKTTTKSMIHHILAGRRTGRASPKSFNNAIGVPLTLLSAEAADEYLVVEIGTNAPGEVAALAALARPNIAVITSIGEEHLEGLGDLSGVAAEECSLLNAMTGGFAAVNVDWPGTRALLPERDLAGDDIRRTGSGRSARDGEYVPGAVAAFFAERAI